MLINPLSITNVASYVDRLKQGGGDAHGNTFDLKKVNKSIGSRFSELLNDPMVQMGQSDALQGFLGIGTGKDANDMTALDSAIFGSMNLTNAKALATLTKVMGDEQNPFASMFRTIASPEGNSLRMPVNRGPAPAATPEAYQQLAALLNGAEGIQNGMGGMDIAGEMEAIKALRQANQHGQKARHTGAAQNVPRIEIEGPDDLLNPANMTDHAETSGRTRQAGSTDQAEAMDRMAQIAEADRVDGRTASQPRLGSLAALFESGSDGGIAAIGFDRKGGTSYGKYQMSSRAGTMDGFVQYLESEAPDIAAQLKKAGRANTGSRFGNMPETWKSIAATQPRRFEDLQDRFIHSNNFSPAFKAISKAMNLEHMNPAMKEVLFSTAVQHGPTGAVRIFAKAYGRTGGYEEGKEASFIRNVYKIRQKQFGDSSEAVQRAVQGRLGDELRMALSMLEQGDRA